MRSPAPIGGGNKSISFLFHYFATYLQSLRHAWNATPNVVHSELLRVVRGRQPDIVVIEPYTERRVAEVVCDNVSFLDAPKKTDTPPPVPAGAPEEVAFPDDLPF